MKNTELIASRVKELLGNNPRIAVRVNSLIKYVDGYDGTEIVLWYPHCEGRDDNREPSNDNEWSGVRIQRLKIKEANALGELVAEVARDFPELEVTLEKTCRCQFTYYFLPK